MGDPAKTVDGIFEQGCVKQWSRYDTVTARW